MYNQLALLDEKIIMYKWRIEKEYVIMYKVDTKKKLKKKQKYYIIFIFDFYH